jgi:glycosyltransferase involved in cell wall biosynthesis
VIIKLLHEIPNSQVLKEFENSHILINQIAFYDLGQVTMEAMASGMVVISSSLRTNEQIPEFDKSCPVTFANFETLAEKLSWFIDHPEEIRIAAEKGRKYVEKFHDYREVGRELVNAIETDCDE